MIEIIYVLLATDTFVHHKNNNYNFDVERMNTFPVH